jgi:hypothetical protein
MEAARSSETSVSYRNHYTASRTGYVGTRSSEMSVSYRNHYSASRTEYGGSKFFRNVGILTHRWQGVTSTESVVCYWHNVRMKCHENGSPYFLWYRYVTFTARTNGQTRIQIITLFWRWVEGVNKTKWNKEDEAQRGKRKRKITGVSS